MIICHIEVGGAFRVAKFYSEALNVPLMIRPNIFKFTRELMRSDERSPVIFHSNKFSALYAPFVRVLRPNKKIYCVEHFVISQIVRCELQNKIKKSIFFFTLLVNKFFGVVPIVLDDYCAKNRKKFFPTTKAVVVHNPVFFGKSKRLKNNFDYDIVWCAGLSSQKMWPNILETFANYLKENQNLKIAMVSYDCPDESELEKIKLLGIQFYQNLENWFVLAPTFFFTSNYEGYPLVLIEAINAKMNIVAWAPRSCYTQILSKYSRSLWVSNKIAAPDLDSFIFSKKKLNTEWMQRHNQLNIRNVLLEL